MNHGRSLCLKWQNGFILWAYHFAAAAAAALGNQIANHSNLSRVEFKNFNLAST